MNSAKRSAFFAGTFNPFTIGHMSVVQRALSLFDTIVIGVGANIAKPESALQADDNAAVIARAFAGDPRVRVVTYTTLTHIAAKEHGCTHLLRGVRSVADFEYERNMADANRNLGGLETVILFTIPEQGYISSTLVRDLESHGGDISTLVP